MSRGCFINRAGRVLYYGLRSDKISLESECIFVEGLIPKVASESYDEYYWNDGDWVRKENANMPADEQEKAFTLSTEGQDRFKKMVLNALYDLAKKDQPELKRNEYLENLWRSTRA